MKKIIKEIVIINIIAVFLLIFYIIGSVLWNDDPSLFDYILPLWILTVIPAYIITYHYINNKSTTQAIDFGIKMGIWFDWFAFFIPLLIAPYLGYKYYIFQMKQYKLKKLYHRD